eukprot:gene23272-biopygen8529
MKNINKQVHQNFEQFCCVKDDVLCNPQRDVLLHWIILHTTEPLQSFLTLCFLVGLRKPQRFLGPVRKHQEVSLKVERNNLRLKSGFPRGNSFAPARTTELRDTKLRLLIDILTAHIGPCLL